MCRTISQGGARCARAHPTPGAPASGPERALTRAESVAAAAQDEAAGEIDAALDALFTAVSEAVSPEERARALAGWLSRVGAAWTRLVRALERVHTRRLAALDARWAEHLEGVLAGARAERHTRERAALAHLHACELNLAAVELAASTPDWSDPFWHEEQWAGLDDVGTELAAESRRLVALERRARTRSRPDPRVLAELRSTRARVACWQTTMYRQRDTLLGLPATPTEADEAVAAARADVAAARAATGELTDDEHNYLAHPDLAEQVEYSRQHPEQRVGRPVRA